jgi:hypothetical protein
VTPGFFGRGPALHWSLWERVELPYVGVAALLLAAYGLVVATPAARRHQWVWVGMALFGLLVSLGVYGILHGILTVLLPMFDQFRAPARALVLWALGVSVLAAAGVELVARRTLQAVGGGQVSSQSANPFWRFLQAAGLFCAADYAAG